MSISSGRFMRACHLQEVDATPVWFMRQAGRSLPEYREVRAKHSFLTVCNQPDLCAAVTLQPVERLGVDAAILFADIMTPLLGLGVDLELVEGVGPVVARPIRCMADLDQLRPLEPDADLAPTLAAIRLVRRDLGDRVPLIGFAGAPFTLASYLIEGGPSRRFTTTKALMYRDPALWHALMERLTRLTAAYLSAQLAAGVDAVQLFDSWVGCLSPQDYATYVHPYSSRIAASLSSFQSPLIHFGADTATLLPQMRAEGGTVIGLDWRIPLDEAWDLLGPDLAVQGNLDPAVLLAPWEVVAAQTSEILCRAAGRPGHIFNLGHGIYPETPVDTLLRLVDFVHEQTARSATSLPERTLV